MTNNHLRIDLSPREDKNKQLFYVGKLQYPGFIDLREGITFLVFLGESGCEEIQIATSNKNNTPFSNFIRKSDKVKITLETRTDKYKQNFYVCKLKLDGLIDCRGGVDFIVFTANLGMERLQIVAPIVKNSSAKPSTKTVVQGPEIIVRQRRLSVDT